MNLHLGITSNDSRGSFLRYSEDSSDRSKKLDLTVNALSMATNIEVGTMRGIHFQTFPFEQEKIVVCTQGAIFDVIVDLRPGSKTLGDWAQVELEVETPASLTLPKGIAHGYQTLIGGANVFYALSGEYSPEHSFAINYTDTDLNIPWPLSISRMSKNDEMGISLQEAIRLSESSH